MSGKNKGFAADLVSALDPVGEQPRPRGVGGILAGRSNRLAELANGSVVTRTHELVDPARCRMWPGHNRDYSALNEERCSDLIESMKAQGKQEVPAIVRRIRGSDDYDYEVICGARRHWSVSWLREHNYPDFRFLVEPRELTDEEAFRLADLENRARDDLTDLERARDYLRALDSYYDGRQKGMAERLNVSESWLSRYLDLGRFPEQLMQAFPDPHALKIKHVTLLKPLLKPEERRLRVFETAGELATQRKEGRGGDVSVPDIIRLLSKAADAPKKTVSPKKTGREAETVCTADQKPILRVEKRSPKSIILTLLPKGGGSREEAEAAVITLIQRYWS